jgi:hypothetical protein
MQAIFEGCCNELRAVRVCLRSVFISCLSKPMTMFRHHSMCARCRAHALGPKLPLANLAVHGQTATACEYPSEITKSRKNARHWGGGGHVSVGRMDVDTTPAPLVSRWTGLVVTLATVSLLVGGGTGCGAPFRGQTGIGLSHR